jgi:hypothetical protein
MGRLNDMKQQNDMITRKAEEKNLENKEIVDLDLKTEIEHATNMMKESIEELKPIVNEAKNLVSQLTANPVPTAEVSIKLTKELDNTLEKKVEMVNTVADKVADVCGKILSNIDTYSGIDNIANTMSNLFI